MSDSSKLPNNSIEAKAEAYAATTLAEDKRAVAHDWEMGYRAALQETQQSNRETSLEQLTAWLEDFHGLYNDSRVGPKSKYLDEAKELLSLFTTVQAQSEGDIPEVAALVSKSARGMDAAFFGSLSLVKKHGAAFVALQRFMDEHAISELLMGGMRIQPEETEQADCEPEQPNREAIIDKVSDYIDGLNDWYFGVDRKWAEDIVKLVLGE